MISKEEFLAEAKRCLEGLPLLDLLTQAKIGTDEKGNILPHVIKNLETMFKVASEMAPEEIAKEKLRQMLIFVRRGQR